MPQHSEESPDGQKSFYYAKYDKLSPCDEQRFSFIEQPSEDVVDKVPPMGGRWILPVVSLILWVAVFMLVVGIIIAYTDNLVLLSVLDPVLIIGLLAFTALVLFINLFALRR